MNAKKVRDLIGNELWTAVSTSKVNTQAFAAIDTAVAKLSDSDDRFDMKELCLAEITEGAKNPIVPRYVATLCGKHPVDDHWAFSVFDEYYNDSKWNEVITIGNKLLSFSEISYVLKALADTYERLNREEEKVSTWERLIRADHSETEVFYKLAEYFEAKDDIQTALNYYKRVIQRHINANDLSSIQEAWPRILKLEGDNTDYLIQIASRIAKVMGNEKGVFFLQETLDSGKADINSKIRILKKILEFSKDNKSATDSLVALLSEKYKDNPRLEYCLEDTGLKHNYMDASTAVVKFEKEIEFNEGAFVFHPTWGLGRIKSINKDEIAIQFLKKKELHNMSCNMAYNSLRILPKQHIMVLKAGAPKEKIREHIMGSAEWGLRMLLNSFNGQASFKQMKAELVPSILSDSDWTTWLAMAKKELSQNQYFSTSDESNDIFVLRETPISFEEKELLIFQREKGFFNKYSILKDFVKKNGSTDSEEFAKMLTYFESETKGDSASAISSYMILKDYSNNNLDEEFKTKFLSLSVSKLSDIYGDIQDADLKIKFVNYVIDNTPNAVEILISLLHKNPSVRIKDAIKENSRKFTGILASTMDNYSSDPDLTLFFFKNCSTEEFAKCSMDEESIISTKLQLLINVSGKVEHGVNAQENRARVKQLTDSLFGDQEIFKFLKKCDTNSAKRIFSFVNNVPGLDEDKTLGIKHFILSNRKDAEAIVSVKEVVSDMRMIPKGFLCTKKMFNMKSQELEHIMNVEIPENSKEIGTARDLGDLRENAEYQYAKDKQKNLNFMMNKLTDELDIAKIINPEDVNLEYVEFGTKVVFTDNLSGKEISQTILGPWESNPENSILNFQAPLGQKIYNMKKGDKKVFEINGVKYDYTVKSIELADFNLSWIK